MHGDLASLLFFSLRSMSATSGRPPPRPYAQSLLPPSPIARRRIPCATSHCKSPDSALPTPPWSSSAFSTTFPHPSPPLSSHCLHRPGLVEDVLHSFTSARELSICALKAPVLPSPTRLRTASFCFPSRPRGSWICHHHCCCCLRQAGD
jgi:hypothetical protein